MGSHAQRSNVRELQLFWELLPHRIGVLVDRFREFFVFSSFNISSHSKLGICRIKGLKIRPRHSISAVNLFFTYIFRESFLLRWTVTPLDSETVILPTYLSHLLARFHSAKQKTDTR
jgi:hypothetical protein